MLDDKVIIQHYWDRDECAITETDEKYGSFCFKIAENILGNKEDSKECVNDTYLKTWNSIPPQRPKVLPAFIGKIVRNLSYDRYAYNRTAKRGGGQINEVFDELAECIADKSADVSCDEKELKEAIDSFLYTISVRDREIFLRRYWYTENVKGIAEKMKMKENSVCAVLKRIRKKLQKYLTERGFDL